MFEAKDMYSFCKSTGLLFLLFLALPLLAPAQAGRADGYIERSDTLAKEKQYEEAIQARRQAIVLLGKEQVLRHEKIVGSYLAISRFFRRDGQLDSSYVYLVKSRQLGERWLEPDSPLLSDVYNSTGIYYYFQGNCQEALRFYKLALERRLMRSGMINSRVADAFNNLAICYDLLGMHKEAIEHFEQAKEIRIELFGEYSSQVAECYLNIGVGYHFLTKYDEALEEYEKALAIWEEKLDPDHPDFALIFNNMGVCYQNKGDYRKAQTVLEKNLDHNLRIYGPEHFEVANSYNNLGLNFFEQGDFSKALVYFEKALVIRQNNFEENHHLIASLYNNIGNCFLERKEFSKALSYMHRALDIRLQVFGPNHRDVADSYNDLGQYYQSVGDYPQALLYYQRALDIDWTEEGAPADYVANSHLKMGECYLFEGDLVRARSSFRKALKLKKETLGPKHHGVAEVYTELAKSYPDDLYTGLGYIDLSLKTLELDQSNRTNRTQVTAPIQALGALNTEGELQLSLYRETGDENWLKKAYATFKYARRVVEITRRSYQEPGSKQLLLDQFFEIFEHSINVNMLLYGLDEDLKYLEEALIISENSKNVFLNEAVQKANADQRVEGVVSDLLNQESELLIDISFYEAQVLSEEQKGRNANPRLLDQYREMVFDKKNAYYNLLDTIRIQDSNYYDLRFGRSDLSLVKLQVQLAEGNQTLIEYFLGDEQLFMFIVTPDTLLLRSQPAGKYLSDLVRELRRQISIFDPLATDPAQLRASFVDVAFPLYNLLIKPAVSLFPSKSLIIVPDGYLGYLPFECLLTRVPKDKGSWKKLPYLLYDYQVSYQYAAGLLVSGHPASELPPKARVLALAPDFGPDQDALLYNKEEVKLLRRQMPGRYLMGREATKKEFKTHADRYRIIHLATHAHANDTIGVQSYLAFSPVADTLESEFLFLRELYNMHFNADMVVMSACETGVGEWKRGEGIVSLGRGFLFAGAQSIVTTLWSVDDQPSALIMDAFYAKLQEGYPKDKALRLAKIEYLQKNSSLRAHPLFWAGYIPVGDMEPVSFQKKISYWAIWATLILALGFLFVRLILYLQQRFKPNRG